MKWLLAIAAMAASPVEATAQSDPDPQARPTEVMVLGTYHWSNPGRDVINMQVDDVLAPRRQREIAVLAESLAQWQPTHIVVEWLAEPPGLTVPEYAEAEELLAERRNESVQLGFRLARMLGHDAVYGFDEQPSDGEPDYFPFGAVQQFAVESGRMAMIEELFAEIEARLNAQQADLAQQTIAESLFVHNDPEIVERDHDRAYYSLLQIGDGDAQPGAELNAYWYMRNAKMFAKLDMIAEPGDRVLVIVGSGHLTWLRHFVQRVPGYRLVEPMPFLIDAAAAGEAPVGEAMPLG
ncbi:MAG: hypothetical protein JY451_13330 [Erythrobacter sp.]|nr:MAG: hypothetical protein JY451_13330 [Erythrobacter sp.]